MWSRLVSPWNEEIGNSNKESFSWERWKTSISSNHGLVKAHCLPAPAHSSVRRRHPDWAGRLTGDAGWAQLCDGRNSQATMTESNFYCWVSGPFLPLIYFFVMSELKKFLIKILLSDMACRLDVKINVGQYLIGHYMALFLNILFAKGLFIAQRLSGDKWWVG